MLLIWRTICQPIALRGLHWVQGQCRQTARVHVRLEQVSALLLRWSRVDSDMLPSVGSGMLGMARGV